MKCQNSTQITCKNDEKMEILLKKLQFNQQVLNGYVSLKDLDDALDTRSTKRTPIDVFDEQISQFYLSINGYRDNNNFLKLNKIETSYERFKLWKPYENYSYVKLDAN